MVEDTTYGANIEEYLEGLIAAVRAAQEQALADNSPESKS
jgi:hypothetical protein